MFELSASGKTIPLKQFEFPGGELGIQILDDPCFESFVTIKATMTKPQDVFALALLADAARRMYKPRFFELVMNYVPYARQDRVCNSGESLSIKVFADFINSLEFDRVVVSDVHSDVTLALLDNVVHNDQAKILSAFCGIARDYRILIAPDAGAEKKIYSGARALGVELTFTASKVRDLQTGKILRTEFPDVELHGSNVLIVDDICDGGMTFIKLAEVLQFKGAEHIALFVTHGIFSKGLDVLKDAGIDEVFTTNSICGIVRDSYLTVLDIDKLHLTK